MADRLLLTGRCDRRLHLMYRVVGTGDGPVIEARLFARGRAQQTWTPMRRKLRDGTATRFGCRCGRTSLVPDALLLADIRRGSRSRLEIAYSIEIN